MNVTAQDIARAGKSVDDCLASMIADVHRPVSFKGCGSWQVVPMMVVQHDQRENSMLISTDGDAKNAKWVPIRSKAGKPITLIAETVAPWMPGGVGFLVVIIPGWLASEREFAQARKPLLSPDIEWTEVQRAHWATAYKAFDRGRVARRADVNEQYKRKVSDNYRRRRAGVA